MSTKFGIVYRAALKIGNTTFVSADMCFIRGDPQNKLFGVIREWVGPSTFEKFLHVIIKGPGTDKEAKIL